MGYKYVTCTRCGAHVERHVQARLPLCMPCSDVRRHERLFATAQVTKAINRGDLPSAKTLLCADCGVTARDYDHRDYTEPLAVEAVCHRCNLKRPAAFDSAYRPAVAA